MVCGEVLEKFLGWKSQIFTMSMVYDFLSFPET